MERYADQLNGSEDLFGLIVDGAALTLIMPFQENRSLLYQVKFDLTFWSTCPYRMLALNRP